MDLMCLGLARTLYIHGVYTVFLAGKSPDIRSCTVYIPFVNHFGTTLSKNY